MVRKHELGYYTVAEMPSEQELADYYSTKYYQGAQPLYEETYDDEERLFNVNQVKQKHLLAQPFLPEESRHSLLDVGCGEGFTLPYFSALGWDVLGTDFSDTALKRHHPDYVDRFIAGNFSEVLTQLRQEGRAFSIVWLDNVLEHSREPLTLLKHCLDVVVPGGLLMVDVPNDFSPLQLRAKEMGLIDRDFWIALPDHLAYFSADSLRNVAEVAGWEHCRTVSDFPIDFNLFNNASNYIMSPDTGKAAHRQRIRLDNLFMDLSPEKTLDLYQALAEMGIGRSINAVFRKPTSSLTSA